MDLATARCSRRNRGRWVLAARAERERYAAFSYTGDHTIKFIAQIDGLEQFGDTRAIVGRLLGPSHPVAQRTGRSTRARQLPQPRDALQRGGRRRANVRVRMRRDRLWQLDIHSWS